MVTCILNRCKIILNVLFVLRCITGGSCHKYHFCRDKTKSLSRQKRVCCDKYKTRLLLRKFACRATKLCLSRQTRQIYVATNMSLSRQNKHTFVATNICRDKTFCFVATNTQKRYLWQIPPTIEVTLCN